MSHIKHKSSVKAALTAICLAVASIGSSAGTLNRTLFGVGLLAGGIALYQSAKKDCHPVKEPDTGVVHWFCDKGPFADTSGATLKNSSTYKLRKALNEERISAGLPPDPDDCDAHHIVPKGESREWAKSLVSETKSAINGCVEIDDVENGVYLPNKKSGGNCEGKYHKNLHTKEYYESIRQRLVDAKRFDGCDGVKQELLQIKFELSNGGLW